MANLPKLTASDIRCLASSESYSRGEDYYENGAVISTTKRGNTIIAEVEGSQYDHDVLVDVYLSEGEIDKAIKLAEKDPHDYSLAEKVADAAIETHPEWVIRVSIKQAEPLIAKTQSKYYAAAIRWLEKAKKAYLKKGGKKAWQQYLGSLRKKYPKKRAFLDMLDRLEDQ